MKYRNIISTALAAVLLSGAFAANQTEEQPNVVFILADDMSYDSVSHFNPGIGDMKTPHIDRLAREGLSFSDGHSGSAVCTPTRYGILTGRYCWRTQLKNSVLWTYGRPLIEKERLTVADLMKAQGYQTGIVGKWHLGMDWPGKDGQVANRKIRLSDTTWRKDDGPERVRECEAQIDFTKPIKGPLEHGFDYYFGMDLPNMAPYTWIENDRVQVVPTIPKPEEIYGNAGLMVPGWKLEDVVPGLANRASEWIAEAAEKERPFFLYVPRTSPHTPRAPSKRFRGNSGIYEYADFVMETDWAVGRIVRALEEAGVAENTLVVFSTDNGTSPIVGLEELKEKGVDLNYHLRGYKRLIYEGGHRVPLIMKWPEVIEAGRVSDETVCLNDFMATMADLTGYALPDDAAEDSSSLLPLVRGETAALVDHPGVISHSIAGQFSIRKGGWKLIHPLDSRAKPVLYDLDEDLKETTDLAQSHPELVAELTVLLKQYVERGRSTPGSVQSNFGNQKSWEGTP